ncbi:MAG: KH domain-containing protein [Atopobiaceae bacterium]|jgi:spoIIIJ-associated protein|nr:KH domain-containing protein [Atopobiaceae bacterium]
MEANIIDDPVSSLEDNNEDSYTTKSKYDAMKSHYEINKKLDESEIDTIADIAINFLRSILLCFNEEHVDVDEFDGDEGELILNISGGDLAVLIGRHGRTLDALQIVLNSYMSNVLDFHYPLIVDIEGYKSRRKDKLEALAKNAALRVKKAHKHVSLPAMTPYERRIIHMSLMNDPSVTTHSEGDEPERHVVVTFIN